jgi:predicted transcriptional regulator
MESTWTFLTNHAHVLLSLAANPDATLREVAEQVGITERAAHRIVGELEQEGALRRSRDGRRNHYEIRREFPLRHPLEQHCSVGHLLKMVSREQQGLRPPRTV